MSKYMREEEVLLNPIDSFIYYYKNENVVDSEVYSFDDIEKGYIEDKVLRNLIGRAPHVGLKIKSNIRLYHGDIIEVENVSRIYAYGNSPKSCYKDKHNIRCKIIYKDCKFSIDKYTDYNKRLLELKGKETVERNFDISSSILHLLEFNSKFKIIGNVFQNENLIK